MGDTDQRTWKSFTERELDIKNGRIWIDWRTWGGNSGEMLVLVIVI